MKKNPLLRQGVFLWEKKAAGLPYSNAAYLQRNSG